MKIKSDEGMDQQTGWFIIFFDYSQSITDVFCGQLIKKSARFLKHPIYEPSMLDTGSCASIVVSIRKYQDSSIKHRTITEYREVHWVQVIKM